MLNLLNIFNMLQDFLDIFIAQHFLATIIL